MTPWRAVARWWRNSRLWVKGALVLALPVVALLAMGIANLVVANQLDHLSSSTSATTASIVGINHGLELALDAETGVRGYAATGTRSSCSRTTKRSPRWPRCARRKRSTASLRRRRPGYGHSAPRRSSS